MSVPGSAREKYTHEVKFVGQKGRGCRRIGVAVGLFVLGLLIYMCCNISSMRSQIREMRRMISEHHHNHHQHQHHDMHYGHDHHSDHHHQRMRGNQNHHHGHPHPHHQKHRHDCQGSAPAQQSNIGAELKERMTAIDSNLKTHLATIEEKIDLISNELHSKQDFSRRIFAKLNEFQSYLKPMLQSLKISNWF